MLKGLKKAPTVAFEKLPLVAEKVNELVSAQGVSDLFAVPVKRTVQWRITFKSDKRKADVGKRKVQEYFDSYGVSKHVAFKKLAAKGIDYDAVLTAAYEAVGETYVASPVNLTPTASVTKKAVKKSAKKVSKKKVAKKATKKVAAKKAAKPATVVDATALDAAVEELLAGA